jgi:hypothetical protein
MKNSPDKNRQRNPSELIALVNEMIADWKEIARKNFSNSYPDSEPGDFEQSWPRTLTNFFLAETVRVAKALNSLSEGRNN